MANGSAKTKRYLVASDFDQTLSFNDSALVLSELVGIPGFEEKVAGLAWVTFQQYIRSVPEKQTSASRKTA
jgi:hypothetical protein